MIKTTSGIVALRTMVFPPFVHDCLTHGHLPVMNIGEALSKLLGEASLSTKLVAA
jgi:hypothetical protein